jgi:hypothetical protein
MPSRAPFVTGRWHAVQFSRHRPPHGDPGYRPASAQRRRDVGEHLARFGTQLTRAEVQDR